MDRRVLKEHAANRIARAIVSDINSTLLPSLGFSRSQDDEARADAIERWTALAAQVLDMVFPGQSEDLDEALKLLKSVEGDWAALNDRMRRVWREEKSEVALPALGPKRDEVVPCVCADEKGPWQGCPWCGGCGWLVPQMKKLLQDATSVKQKTETPPEETERVITERRVLDAMLFVEQMHRLGAIRVETTPRGGVRVDFSEKEGGR
jgi:hypothetical protein